MIMNGEARQVNREAGRGRQVNREREGGKSVIPLSVSSLHGVYLHQQSGIERRAALSLNLAGNPSGNLYCEQREASSGRHSRWSNNTDSIPASEAKGKSHLVPEYDKTFMNTWVLMLITYRLFSPHHSHPLPPTPTARHGRRGI